MPAPSDSCAHPGMTHAEGLPDKTGRRCIECTKTGRLKWSVWRGCLVCLFPIATLAAPFMACTYNFILKVVNTRSRKRAHTHTQHTHMHTQTHTHTHLSLVTHAEVVVTEHHDVVPFPHGCHEH